MVQAISAQNRPGIEYAWSGPALLVTDDEGRCGDHALTGFFFREARYLQDLRLEIDGEPPFLCSLAWAAPNHLEYTYVYPPVESGGGGGSGSGASGKKHGILYRDMDLRLRYEVHPSYVDAVLTLANRWNESITFELAWVLSADYADLLSTLSTAGKRKQDAPVESHPQPSGVHFRYTHAQLPFETHVSIEGGDIWHFAGGRLSTAISLKRQESAQVRLRIQAVDYENPLSIEEGDRRQERVRRWQAQITGVQMPAESLVGVITNRAIHDLGSFALLEGSEDEWLAPAAGYPLYPSLFARDALTAAWQAGVFDRGEMIEEILVRLDRTQGQTVNPERDEEPGRIIRQAKRDPLSRLGQAPYGCYYGDVASPFMYIIALGQLFAWNGDTRLLKKHWDTACRILDWAKTYGDKDGDGYIEYKTQSKKGPKNQGWKDSENAVVYADGRQVPTPIAASEIQGYYYAALQFMAILSAVQGKAGDAKDLWQQAMALKKKFNRDFWMEDEGTVAFGLDPDKKQIKSVVSNAGHCLTTGIVEDEKVPRLVNRLFAPDMYSGWGIRTLSTRNPAYNPLSYHLGSVWTVENGTIMFGLRRYGFDAYALQLAHNLFDLAQIWPNYRIPECVGGYDRGEFGHPGAYPRANAPQAWNQSTFPLLIQGILGLRPVASLNFLAVDPILPVWLPEITLQNLRVGDATVTLRFWRDKDGQSHYETLETQGTLHIVRQPPMDALSVGPMDRLGALVQDLLPI